MIVLLKLLVEKTFIPLEGGVNPNINHLKPWLFYCFKCLARDELVKRYFNNNDSILK